MVISATPTHLANKQSNTMTLPFTLVVREKCIYFLLSETNLIRLKPLCLSLSLSLLSTGLV